MSSNGRQPTVGTQHPTTLLLSVHKSASTFLAQDLAPAMLRTFEGLVHVPFHEMMERGVGLEHLTLPSRGMIMSRLYPAHYDMVIEDPVPAGGRFADKKLVLLRRDPRDVAVSLYYSVAYSHSMLRTDAEHFAERRAALRDMDVAEAIRTDTAPVAIRQFRATFEFASRYPHVLVTDYETLVGDLPAWMRRVADYLEWSGAEREAVSEGLEQSVQPPEQVDPREHKRRVTPGNWRDVFDDRLRRIFEHRVGPEMEEAGYDW